MPRTRRHHNNSGLRQIKEGRTVYIERLIKKLKRDWKNLTEVKETTDKEVVK